MNDISRVKIVQDSFTKQDRIGSIKGKRGQFRTKDTDLEPRRVRLNREIAIVDRDIISLGSRTLTTQAKTRQIG
jgi:hypothetical protein